MLIAGLLLPAALGHVALLVWLMNVPHGFAIPERTMDRLMAAVVSCWTVATALLVWTAWGVPWSQWPGWLRLYTGLCALNGAVVVPVSTLALRLRKTPDGIASSGTEVALAEPHELGTLIGPGRHNWMLRLPGSDATRLRRVEWSVALRGLPGACDGLSLLHLTDLHFAPCYARRYFERVVDEAMALESDLVVFTGDLLDDESCLEWVVPVLSRLRGRLGTFAILGNHDYSFDAGPIRRELESAGFTDLDGRWTTLKLGPATVALGGTSCPWGPALDLSTPPAADLRVVLSHTPDLFPSAAAAGIDLVLAGHNHGGQVRLPVVGPIFMPSRYGRRYHRGWFRQGRTLMSVGQGIGGKHPVRYGCPPELSRLVLRSAHSDASSGATARPHGRKATRVNPV